jgi:hypothetical protein
MHAIGDVAGAHRAFQEATYVEMKHVVKLEDASMLLLLRIQNCE